MAEADELCERIAIVDHGRILAIGTPDELKKRVQRESIFRLELDRLDAGIPALARLPGVVSAAPAADSDPELQRVAVNLVLEEDAALGGVVTALARHRQPHPRPAQVRADARGRVRGARRPRVRRRRRRRTNGHGHGPDARSAAATMRTTASRTCRPTPAPTRPRRPTRWRPADDRRHGARRRAPDLDLRRPPATAPTRGRPRPGRGARSSRTTRGRSSAARSRASAAWSASRRGCSSRSCCRS